MYNVSIVSTLIQYFFFTACSLISIDIILMMTVICCHRSFSLGLLHLYILCFVSSSNFVINCTKLFMKTNTNVYAPSWQTDTDIRGTEKIHIGKAALRKTDKDIFLIQSSLAGLIICHPVNFSNLVYNLYCLMWSPTVTKEVYCIYDFIYLNYIFAEQIWDLKAIKNVFCVKLLLSLLNNIIMYTSN